MWEIDSSPSPLDLPLRRRGLRYVLLAELRRRPQMTVAEMVSTLLGQGFTFAGRPSKIISDALRWEVRAGRVERLARGVYRFRTASRSRNRRALLLVRWCRRWKEAIRLGQRPPPVPPEPRPNPFARRQPSDRPPWDHLGWLWAR